MSGPGADLGRQLLARLTPLERDFLDRWSQPTTSQPRSRELITGFLAGRFLETYGAVELSNAARAIAEGEVELP